MLEIGSALRVLIHVNEDIGSRSDYLHNELFAFLHSNDVSGATVFRPHAGFGSHHRVHTKGVSGAEGEHLPIRIEFVESEKKVESLLPQLFELVTDGMIEVQETTVLHIARQPFRHQHEDGSRG
jgi:PII-like signaling protein